MWNFKNSLKKIEKNKVKLKKKMSKFKRRGKILKEKRKGLKAFSQVIQESKWIDEILK